MKSEYEIAHEQECDGEREALIEHTHNRAIDLLTRLEKAYSGLDLFTPACLIVRHGITLEQLERYVRFRRDFQLT